MFEPKIRIARELYKRLTKTAEQAGYSSVDEFIIHLLEKAASGGELAQGKEEVRKRLQGLGYLE